MDWVGRHVLPPGRAGATFPRRYREGAEVARKPDISDEDAALFRRSAGPVRRLADDRVHFEKPRPGPKAPVSSHREPEPDPRDAMPDDLPRTEEQLYTAPGLQTKQAKRLRRGQMTLEAELDLHGKTVREARRALTAFLETCRQEGWRCVRIIHGKGTGSREGRAVIKWEVDRLLREHDRVMAFASARPRDGGTGALYVLLRR